MRKAGGKSETPKKMILGSVSMAGQIKTWMFCLRCSRPRLTVCRNSLVADVVRMDVIFLVLFFWYIGWLVGGGWAGPRGKLLLWTVVRWW